MASTGHSTQPTRSRPKARLNSAEKSPAAHPSNFPSTPDSESAGANNSDALPEFEPHRRSCHASVLLHRESIAFSVPSGLHDILLRSSPPTKAAPEASPANSPVESSLKIPTPARVRSHSPARAHSPANRNSPDKPAPRVTPGVASPCIASHVSAQNDGPASEYPRAVRAESAW